MILNNCEEVIDFLVESYSYPYSGIVSFQGELTEVDGYLVDNSIGSELVVCKKYPSVMFVVGDNNVAHLYDTSHSNCFLLSIIIGRGNFDQRPGILLPREVREEMIATILEA